MTQKNINTDSHIIKKITLWTSLGSMLEYYDFIVYGMMAKYLGVVFFKDQSLAIVQTFLIFAVGYFSRPLGGIIFGIIGDLYGRKKSFLILTALMTISTLMVGLLPTFEKIGMFAPIILAICRVVQGVSFGGELPGATTIVTEFSSKKNKGWFSSFIIASTSLGALIANLILFLLTYFFIDNQVIAWAWRIPFIVGGLAGIILFIGRSTLEESPIFINQVQNLHIINPLYHLIKNYKLHLINGFLLTTFLAALIITNVYYPYYLSACFGYSSKEIYFHTMLSLIFSVFIFPVFGKMSDFVNKAKMLAIVCMAYLFFCFPMFYMLHLRSTWVLMLFLIINQCFIALFAVAFYPIITNLFRPKIRYTGLALCYNVAFATMSLLPSLFTYLIEHNITTFIVPIALCFFAMASLISSKFLPPSNC